jgi:hypothetical protein
MTGCCSVRLPLVAFIYPLDCGLGYLNVAGPLTMRLLPGSLIVLVVRRERKPEHVILIREQGSANPSGWCVVLLARLECQF